MPGCEEVTMLLHDAFEPEEVAHLQILIDRLDYLEGRKAKRAKESEFTLAEATALRGVLGILGVDDLPPAPIARTPEVYARRAS